MEFNEKNLIIIFKKFRVWKDKFYCSFRPFSDLKEKKMPIKISKDIKSLIFIKIQININKLDK